MCHLGPSENNIYLTACMLLNPVALPEALGRLPGQPSGCPRNCYGTDSGINQGCSTPQIIVPKARVSLEPNIFSQTPADRI
jgi:hypothetical protein